MKDFEFITEGEMEQICDHFMRSEFSHYINRLLNAKKIMIYCQHPDDGEWSTTEPSFDGNGFSGSLKYEGCLFGVREIEEEKPECDHMVSMGSFTVEWEVDDGSAPFCPKCGKDLR